MVSMREMRMAVARVRRGGVVRAQARVDRHVARLDRHTLGMDRHAAAVAVTPARVDPSRGEAHRPLSEIGPSRVELARHMGESGPSHAANWTVTWELARHTAARVVNRHTVNGPSPGSDWTLTRGVGPCDG